MASAFMSEDLPDLKPDMATLEATGEPQDPLSVQSESHGYILPDDPPDVKPDLSTLKVKDERPDPSVDDQADTGDPLDLKPDESTLELKEEKLIPSVEDPADTAAMGLPRLLWIRVKAALAFVWALVRRAFCCFRRRRKLSNVGPPIAVNVQSVPAPQQQDAPTADWSWEEPPTAIVTVQDKIRAYRDSRTRVSESEPAPEPDFFSDMAPTIRRSQKVLVVAEDRPQQQTAAPGGFSSRLAYTDSALQPQDTELTDMEEPTAWEADDINPDALESHQRALRHQQLQQKRESRRTGAGAVR